MATPVGFQLRLPCVYKFDFPANLYRISARPEVFLRLKPGVPAPSTGTESHVDPKHFDLKNYEGEHPTVPSSRPVQTFDPSTNNNGLGTRGAALRPYSFLHAVLRKHARYQDPKLVIWEIQKRTFYTFQVYIYILQAGKRLPERHRHPTAQRPGAVSRPD
jgi:hypothetical protein